MRRVVAVLFALAVAAPAVERRKAKGERRKAKGRRLLPFTLRLSPFIWHMLEKGAIRPYVGAGAGYVILKNVERRFIGASGIEFDDPVGFVVDGGVLIPLGKRWSATADARYTPIETQARATFTGTPSSVRIDVKPLVVSFGIAYHF